MLRMPKPQVIGVIGALIVTGLAFILLSVKESASVARPSCRAITPTQAYVAYVLSTEQATAQQYQEQAWLLDTAPLFLPTDKSASADFYQQVSRSKQGVFEPFQPQTRFYSLQWRTQLPTQGQRSSVRWFDWVDYYSKPVLSALGRTHAPQGLGDLLPYRVYIYRVHDGAFVADYCISDEFHADPGEPISPPASFLFYINHTGAIAAPHQQVDKDQSSRVVQIYVSLQRSPLLYQLPEGYYRAEIGP